MAVVRPRGLAVAGLASLFLAGCGSGGSVVSAPGTRPNGAHAPASPQTPSLLRSCSGERYAHRRLPSQYSRVLRRTDWKYFGGWARIGQVLVVSVVYAETADSHQRAVLFIDRPKIIGSDAASPGVSHFDARICSVGRHSVVTGYLYRLMPSGPDRLCPRPRPTFGTVRWRVTRWRAVPLDHVPGECR